MLDGIRIIERVAARGATFKALDRRWLDLTTPLGKGILAFLSTLAEDERSRVLARVNGGRAAAKKKGVKFGPKPKLAAHQQREAVRMVREGQSLRAVAHHYHVGLARYRTADAYHSTGNRRARSSGAVVGSNK
jgi:DNA invertase Pin-like site-specific DNA recombinase